MKRHVDLFDSTYANSADTVPAAVRRAAFGVDIGQASWLTVDEYERFLTWLDPGEGGHVLDVASGSGGPAIYLARTTGCYVTGIDANESGVVTASRLAIDRGAARNVQFRVANASAPLPFDDSTFDAIHCIDSMSQFRDRFDVLSEWHRVLRPGRRALFTDPVVITGPTGEEPVAGDEPLTGEEPVTGDELALLSSIGPFPLVPPDTNEDLIERAGLELVHREDVSADAATVADRWRRARDVHRDEMIRIEGDDRFEMLQDILSTAHRLMIDRRLSRIVYVMQKR